MSRWVALGGVVAGATGKDGAMAEPAVTSVPILDLLRGLERFDRRAATRAVDRRVMTEPGVA